MFKFGSAYYFRFHILINNLKQKFPFLKDDSFSIHWTDDDGDMMTIADDEDLGIAIDYQTNKKKGKDEVCRIKVVVNEKDSSFSKADNIPF